MRILSIDFPTSLFHSTTQGWNQTPPHETKNPTVSIAHTLKNFLLWLIFINLINHYISNFKLYFGEIDIVLYYPIHHSNQYHQQMYHHYQL